MRSGNRSDGLHLASEPFPSCSVGRGYITERFHRWHASLRLNQRYQPVQPDYGYGATVARRLPGVRGRLEVAAIELFATQGFAATTGAQIAQRAGTTERTFFRHFTDKADAAFGDELRLREELRAEIVGRPAGDEPSVAVGAGFEMLADLIEQNPKDFRRRAAVVAGNAELRDRELARATGWSDVIVSALAERDVAETNAQLCAALHLALFRIATQRWTGARDRRFREVVIEVRKDALMQLTATM